MNIPQDRRYTKTHEWAKDHSGEVLVGITAHAQEELRDIVYIELPAVGKTVTQGAPAAVVESVKAAFDIYAPVSGVVTRANAILQTSPQLVNQDCYEAGWLFAIQPNNPQELTTLLTADVYTKLIHTVSHH